MINYQYTETPYVDPVNLEILGKTYDTLEEGHHKAVEAESALKAQIANLPLNEAEDGFKQALLNDLNATIEENTRFGNKYSALDDIVRVNGDISSNPGLIGRLKAQEDYMAFQDALDKAEIPDAYKEMYRELNPYSYQDKYDKDGNVIGGTKWTPTSRPVKTIDLSDIITKGISWASAEAGGSTVTRWLDENGQITTDPTKAFDGEYYNATENSWQRLGRDKILAGIQAAIESTPGAKESLEQDYKFAEWKHNKLVNESNGQLVISDITDERGMKLTPQEYLMKRIEPAVYAKEYYNSSTETTYGKGLSTYKSAQAAAIKKLSTPNKFFENTTSGTPTTFESDFATEYSSNKTSAIANINSILEEITGTNPMLQLAVDEKIGDRYNNILNDPNINPDIKVMLRKQIALHDEAVTNINNYRNAITNEEDKAKFDFAIRMQSGGQLIAKDKGGTVYDDKFLEALSKYQNENGDIIINYEEDDDIKLIVKDILNGDEYEGYKNLGVRFNDKGIVIPKNKINVAPMILGIINEAQRIRNKGFFNTVIANHWSPFNYQINDEYSNWKNVLNAYPGLSRQINEHQRFRFDALGDLYNELMTDKDKIYEKYMPGMNTTTMSTKLFSGDTWDEKYYWDQYLSGNITKTEYDDIQQRFKDVKKNFIENHDYTQGMIYMLDKNSNTLTAAKDSKTRNDITVDIIKTYTKDPNDVSLTPAMVPGLYDEHGLPAMGYYVSFIETNSKNEPITNYLTDENGKRTYFITSLIDENLKNIIATNPDVRAEYALVGINNNMLYKDLNGDTSLPKSSITGVGDGTYKISCGGYESFVDESKAKSFLTAMYTYGDQQAHITYTGGYNEQQTEIIKECANIIADCVNTSPEIIQILMANQLNKNIK